MPILFSAVAYQKKVLAKHASCDGNFKEIFEEVLPKILAKDHKMTYLHGAYLFHYIAEEEYIYFCITDKTCQRSRSFLFLNEIRRRFESKPDDFDCVLPGEMYRYSEDYSTITIRKGELDELNSIGVGDSETILGDKILSVNNPENLSFSTISQAAETPQQIQDLSESIVNSTDNVIDSKDESYSKFHFIFVTVILLFIWLAITTCGPTSFVIVACIFLLSFVRLSKVENKSK